MTNHTITTISSLITIIETIRNENKGCELFFRGQKKNFKEIKPSIARNNLLKSEDILFKEYILRNPNDFLNEKTTFEKLAKMQHYKLPTRLLDITTNPLVALYFCVEDDKEFNRNNGCFVIYCIPHKFIKYYDSDTVSVVSNISRRPINELNIKGLVQKENEKEKTWIERFNDNHDIEYLLHEIKEEKPYFKNIIVKEHLETIWCVKPLLKNRRIIKQDGAFLLFGINESKKQIAEYNPNEFVPMKFIVKNKKTLRKQLNLLGISKDKLYPELDTTAEYLSNKYSK